LAEWAAVDGLEIGAEVALDGMGVGVDEGAARSFRRLAAGSMSCGLSLVWKDGGNKEMDGGRVISKDAETDGFNLSLILPTPTFQLR
jgi:hypothetical protein